MTLNEQIKTYASLKAQADDIANKMNDLKYEIFVNMGDETFYSTPDGFTAKIVTKETFKYVDETAMVNWLESHGYGHLVVKKVNTTPMNKELKKGLSLSESLKTMYTKSCSESLVIESPEK